MHAQRYLHQFSVILETPQLHTPIYLKGPLPVVGYIRSLFTLDQVKFTLLYVVSLSCNAVLMWFYKQYSFTLAGTALFTAGLLRVYYYLLCRSTLFLALGCMPFMHITLHKLTKQ